MVVCKRGDPKACYVKANLMPSRALGDLRLKMSEFNAHNFPQELGYRMPIPKYTGPYISHVPDIQVLPLTKDDEFLVLASDGLWDEIPRKAVPGLIKDTNLKPIALGYTIVYITKLGFSIQLWKKSAKRKVSLSYSLK